MPETRGGLRLRSLLCRLALAVAATGTAAGQLAAQQLQLRFFDVGQGDAALLITPEGRTMLVDAGQNARSVIAFLRANHLDTLDLVVVSHIHDDHMGGIPDVLGAVVVRNFMDNGTPRARTYGRYLNAVRASGARYLEATARTITLGSVQVRVLPPPDARLRLARADQNNRSVGLLIQYGRFRALLAGDSQRQEIGYWLQFDSVPPVTLVKLSHHGSDNGTTTAWAERTGARIAVISVGRNSYGHPGRAALATWCRSEARVIRTDKNGSILVRTDSLGGAIVRAVRAPDDTTLTDACGGIR
ncbi:MAG: hypothetical protein A2083_05180 [Gemmatimonadetes bacterium GWC2_71_9]|nr:MAG: hypothetical protein A2083_05180 [Gemmatimonadetes bacterium GWC2_71_9]